MGKGAAWAGARPNVPMEGTIETWMQSTALDYGSTFRSTVGRFSEAGKNKTSPRIGPGLYKEISGGIGNASATRPTPPAFSAPRSPRFVNVFTTADVDPKWTAEHDARAWTERGGQVAGNAFGKSPRGTQTARSLCSGEYTERGSPERSGKNRNNARSPRSVFRSRVGRFGGSPPPKAEKFAETTRALTAEASASRGPGIHDQGNGRGPKQTYDWKKADFMERPHGVFILPKARGRPRNHLSAGKKAVDPGHLGPGSYEMDVMERQKLQEAARPSASFRKPSKPLGHRSPYHKGPDSTWQLKTDARIWTRSSKGFAWGGGRAERPLNDRLSQRGAVSSGAPVPAA